MTSRRFAGTFLVVCAGLFLLYLLAPIVLMGVTAFNTSTFPRVSPFECFTTEWFGALGADGRLLAGLKNSVYIGLGVVLLAVPIGLAGALLLTRLPARARPWYFALVASPILIPGVVLGISTLVFWDRLGRMFGTSGDSLFYNGIFLTIVGQTTFVAAYCLLIFLARLQRFELAQEEAAMDLGATPGQSFRKVLLPFLKPAIASAAVVAFLASFENYNTTVFTSLTRETLVTVLASKVRYGINPSISALAVAIVALTLLCAAAYEMVRRRETSGAAPAAAAPRLGFRFRSPALALLLLVCAAGAGTIYFAGTVGVEECKAAAQAEKRRRARKRVEALGNRLAPAAEAESPSPNSSAEREPGVFAPQTLAPSAPEAERTANDGENGEATNPFSAQLAPSARAPRDGGCTTELW